MKHRRQVLENSQPDTSTGSPTSGEPVYLAVGRIKRSHGVNGDFLMDVVTDFPERIRTGKTVYVGESHSPMRIASLRSADRNLIIRFAGFSTPEQASQLRNETVYVKADGLPALPEGQYYHHELIGLKVLDLGGQLLGVLESIIETGSNDVYVVKTPQGKELLLPAVEDVIHTVDLENRQMTVQPPEYY